MGIKAVFPKVTLDQFQKTSVRSPERSVGGIGHQAIADFGKPWLQGRPLKHQIAQLLVSSAVHAAEGGGPWLSAFKGSVAVQVLLCLVACNKVPNVCDFSTK